MRILILNGSPAGKDSITLQTVEYLKILFPEHDYETLHVGQQIRSMEKDFRQSKVSLEAADLILFCYPVYTFLVPAQLHRFIELIKESGAQISGKYATQITTSKHFYDMTAHRFIEDNCADMHLKYIRGLSADMEDILTEKGQKEAEDFFSFLLWNIQNGFCEKPSLRPAADFMPFIASEIYMRSEEISQVSCMNRAAKMFEDQPEEKHAKPSADPPEDHPSESSEKDQVHVALVTDFDPESPSKALTAMIRKFENRLPGSVEMVNLHEFPFKGGCLGCFNCASDGTCIYNDGFDKYLREHINSADAVVFAYTIKDHSMGYRFKLYDDRQFCNGHRTVTMGKPVAYLVDGNLTEEENLRTLMEARAQVGGNYLAGVASDETDPDAQIDQMVQTLVYAVQHKYTQPKNFYGVGGLKIFRDLIYEMRGLMKEDHRFYKQHGFYDFPQKRKGRIAGMYLVSAMMNNKMLKKKMSFTMTDGMMMPYKKVLEKTRSRER